MMFMPSMSHFCRAPPIDYESSPIPLLDWTTNMETRKDYTMNISRRTTPISYTSSSSRPKTFQVRLESNEKSSELMRWTRLDPDASTHNRFMILALIFGSIFLLLIIIFGAPFYYYKYGRGDNKASISKNPNYGECASSECCQPMGIPSLV